MVEALSTSERLSDLYQNELRQKFQTDLGLGNIMETKLVKLQSTWVLVRPLNKLNKLRTTADLELISGQNLC